MPAALLRPVFNADDGEQARELVGDALERLRTRLRKAAALLDEAEKEARSPSPAFPAANR